MQTFVAAAAAVLLVVAPFAQAPQQPAPATDLTGAWKYNPDLSEMPQNRPPSAGIAGGPGSAGGAPQPAAGRMGGGGFRPEGANAVQTAKMREALRDATEAPEQLTIALKDGALVVTDGDGRSRVITPDGKKAKGETALGLPLESMAHWEEALLIVERKFDGGVEVVDQYSMLTDPKQLVIISIVETAGMKGEQALKVRRVYDAIP